MNLSQALPIMQYCFFTMKLGYPERDIQPLDKFEDMLQMMRMDQQTFRDFGYPMYPSTPFLENWLGRLSNGERFILTYEEKQDCLSCLTPHEETILPAALLPPDFPLADYIWQQLRQGRRVLVQGKVFQNKVMRGLITVFTGK